VLHRVHDAERLLDRGRRGAKANSPRGVYAIICSAGTLSATNYRFTFVNGTLTVA
jgi:hypothetical protein